MPPKPQSTTSKEVDEAVQQVSDKLGTLQSQILELQAVQDTRYENLQTLMHNLLEQFSNLNTPPPNPTSTMTIPTPTLVLDAQPPLPPRIGTFPTSGPPRNQLPTPLPNPSIFPQHHPFPSFPPYSIDNPHMEPRSDNMAPPFFQSPNHSSNFHPAMPSTPNPTIRPPKLQLIPFDGQDPLDWVFQADQFFLFYQIPLDQRLSMAAFYMKGEALSWFKWMYNNGQLTSWSSFTHALELRFGPSSYDNYQAELFKLKQTGSVSDYQSNFEKLCNRVYGLSPDALLNCFISGLNSEIQKEIAILKPSTITQALGLAKLIEAKLKDSKPKPFRPSSFSNPTNRVHTTPTTPSTSLPIKKLTPAQMQERRAQGLCYNCDDKFIPGHKCSTPKFLLLLAEEDTTTLETPQPMDDIIEDNPETLHFQLSSQAIQGNNSPRALKFTGLIYGLHVSVLVDTGSSHNIIQPRIANYLRLHLSPITPFTIMVGNGEHLTCDQICPKVPLRLRNHIFSIPCYLLPIQGADIVLGLDWLSTLGQVAADFATPSLSFIYQDLPITLTGDYTTNMQQASYHHLAQLSHNHSIAACHILSISTLPNTQTTTNSLTSPSPNELAHLPFEIQTLLLSLPDLFSTPKELPPERPHDHHINLLPNTKPVNVKPYRYPHHQKNTIATLISEMLSDGIIKPSHSPFSSPVLLVKKKDGSWRFCVDYRALNAVTMKDSFPIPTVDELLDELGTAKVFTKLDLRSGYHQIRVSPTDTHKTAFRTWDGHYEFLVLPFSLTNAPATFQSAMNDLLRPYLRKFVLVFFDDILIYSTSFADHLVHLRLILNLLVTNKFYAKFSKCDFAVTTVHYLGHLISEGVMTPDPDKIQAINEWPQPRSLSALRGFLGLSGFYRKFIKNYASLAAPLTDLLRENKFTWTTEASQAFTELKKTNCHYP